ncbi:MAG: hypothetical protein HPY79_12320 [Bacteroidales bacterium]|nr:hypothetical protein [Bacteroidales bacterium]
MSTKVTFLIRLLFLVVVLNLKLLPIYSQVAINSTGANPDASAGLDVSFSNKGVLIPRVALTQTTSASPITSPVTSLLVYNTATVNDVTPGYYYWYNNRWNRLQTSGYSGAVSGTFATIPNHFSTIAPSFGFVGSYIDLPPGKWIVYAFLLLAPNNGGAVGWDDTGFDRALWGSFTLCESSTTFSFSPDIIGSPLISGGVVAPSRYGMTGGAIHVVNSSSNVKRYYLWGRIGQFNTACVFFNFGAHYWGEDQFFAIPAE